MRYMCEVNLFSNFGISLIVLNYAKFVPQFSNLTYDLENRKQFLTPHFLNFGIFFIVL